MKFLNRLFGFKPQKQADSIDEICAQSKRYCENMKAVSAAIRNGSLSHPRAISEAMDDAMRADYAVEQRRKNETS